MLLPFFHFVFHFIRVEFGYPIFLFVHSSGWLSYYPPRRRGRHHPRGRPRELRVYVGQLICNARNLLDTVAMFF
jgi:hypothetical protein